MRNTTTFAVAALVLSVSLVAESRGAFIQPSSITASSTTINSAGVLINAATGGGGTAYVAPNPGSGGGGTSWYTSAAGTTGVTLNFGFDDPYPLGYALSVGLLHSLSWKLESQVVLRCRCYGH